MPELCIALAMHSGSAPARHFIRSVAPTFELALHGPAPKAVLLCCSHRSISGACRHFGHSISLATASEIQSGCIPPQLPRPCCLGTQDGAPASSKRSTAKRWPVLVRRSAGTWTVPSGVPSSPLPACGPDVEGLHGIEPVSLLVGTLRFKCLQARLSSNPWRIRHAGALRGASRSKTIAVAPDPSSQTFGRSCQQSCGPASVGPCQTGPHHVRGQCRRRLTCSGFDWCSKWSVCLHTSIKTTPQQEPHTKITSGVFTGSCPYDISPDTNS